jgi:murein DD-endopeptidase MepM/ murein hydrolase activator NlpD
MKKNVLVLAGAILGLTACGGTEPLSMLGEGSQAIPAQYFNGPIGFALPIGTVSGTSVTGITSPTPYSTVNEGISFSSSTPGTSTVVRTPAAGFIIATDLTPVTGSVTIYHNAHVTTRIKNISPVGLQVGRYVTASEQIGSTLNMAVIFSVLVDGNLVCPLTYLNSSVRQALFSQFGAGTSLCQI